MNTNLNIIARLLLKYHVVTTPATALRLSIAVTVVVVLMCAYFIKVQLTPEPIPEQYYWHPYEQANNPN